MKESSTPSGAWIIQQDPSTDRAAVLDHVMASAGLKEVDILITPSNLAKQHSTCLDDDQMVAMLACLRQELTLIQGPPGTGEALFQANRSHQGLLQKDLPPPGMFNSSI